MLVAAFVVDTVRDGGTGCHLHSSLAYGFDNSWRFLSPSGVKWLKVDPCIIEIIIGMRHRIDKLS